MTTEHNQVPGGLGLLNETARGLVWRFHFFGNPDLQIILMYGT